MPGKCPMFFFQYFLSWSVGCFYYNIRNRDMHRLPGNVASNGTRVRRQSSCCIAPPPTSKLLLIATRVFAWSTRLNYRSLIQPSNFIAPSSGGLGSVKCIPRPSIYIGKLGTRLFSRTDFVINHHCVGPFAFKTCYSNCLPLSCKPC